LKYVTLESAEIYFNTRIGSDPWDNTSDRVREKALNHAERIFERLSYKDVEVTAGDIFPRGTQTEVPARVKEAIYEEALSLIQGNKTETELSDLHVTSSSLAGFQTSVNEKTDRPWVTAQITSPDAWMLIAPYLLDTRSFRTVA